MPRSNRARGVPVAVYQHLLDINAGFEQVKKALEALAVSRAFERTEIERFSAFAAEARAALLSYVTGVIETAETTEAGRLWGLRVVRERREEGSRQ